MTTDDVLNLLGGYGKFQILVYLALSYVYMNAAWFTFASIFQSYTPDHHCRVPPGRTVNQTIPGRVHNGKWVLEKCQMYRLTGGAVTNATQPCTEGWTYLWDDDRRTSEVSEWDLVCGRGYIADLSPTLYMAGATVGAGLLTPFSDRFGRKWVMLIFFWCQGILALLLTWSVNSDMFSAGRFLIGFLNMPTSLIAYVMMVEIFPSSHRMLPSVYMQVFWAAGIMTLALLGYLVYDWRNLEIALSLPIFLTIPFAFLLPESILWLITKNRLVEAQEILSKATKMNKKALPENIGDILVAVARGIDQESSDNLKIFGITNPALSLSDDTGTIKAGGKKYEDAQDDSSKMEEKSSGYIFPHKRSLLRMLEEPKMRHYCLIMFYLFFSNSFSYYGTTFSTATLSGDRFVNLLVSGAIEIPAYCMISILNFLIGRRIPISMFMLICAAMNTIAIFIPDTDEAAWSRKAVIMAGKFGISGSYACIYLYASEIFPTTIRNQSLGLASFFENLGGLLAPIIVTQTSGVVPLAIFSTFSLIGGLSSLFLPETHKQPLYQTISETVRRKISFSSKNSLK